MTNRLEFHVVDMGAVLLGAAPFSLYNTAPVEQLLFNVDNAEPAVLIAEAAVRGPRARAGRRCGRGIKLVVLEDDLDALEASGAGLRRRRERRGRRARRSADARLHVGHDRGPKGVQYLHSGLMYAVWAFADRLRPVSRGRNVSYLPMAHIAERQIGYYSAFCCGMTITTLIDARHVQAALLEVRPTWFFGVPRIYEKIEVAMLEHVRDDATQAALDAAVERRARRRAVGRRPAAGAAARGDRARARRLGRHLRRALLARDG